MVHDTGIQPEDVIAALTEMAVVDMGQVPKGRVMLTKSKVKAWADMHDTPLTAPVDARAFVSEASNVDDGTDAAEI